MALLFLSGWAIIGKCDGILYGLNVKCVNYIAGLPLFGQVTVRCDSENAAWAQTLAIKWGKSLAIG